ncbi:MAG TPA: hypothetical protein DHV65_05380, partial [Ktedonobacter sp.]|nr:hypothetical protein [Ktedonobacter sp.]
RPDPGPGANEWCPYMFTIVQYSDRRGYTELRESQESQGMPTHKVRFQPVDIEIDVNEDETVLNAAFRQG